MAKLFKFPSGLTVCYEKKRGVGSCAFGVFVNVGSRDEGENDHGVAHFIEHMLFKGTEKRTAFELANETDKLGANSNAYTSKTNTVFYMSGLAKFIENYIEILSDMFFFSTFTDENIAKEKGVVLEEIKMYDDDGDSVCSDMLSDGYFVNDNLSRPILGTEETVKSLDREKIKAFMAKYYTAKNVCLSYCGPDDEEDIKKLIEKYFEAEFNKQGEKADKAKPSKPKTNAFYKTRFDKPFEQASVIMRFPGFAANDKCEAWAKTMVVILGGGMSSRLFQKVREEKGLVYEIYSSSCSIGGTGYIDIGFATAPNLAHEAIKAIRETLEEVKKNGFTEEEFEKVKIQMETSAVLGGETTFDIMRIMGKYYFLTGKLVTFKSLLKKMENITLENVNGIVDNVFDYEKASMCYVGKEIKDDLYALLKKGK